MSRFKLIALITLITLAMGFALIGDALAAGSRYVYVGTYTAPNFAPGGKVPSTAKGIYVFKMEQTQGLAHPQFFVAVYVCFMLHIHS